jgi:hypothetical protein
VSGSSIADDLIMRPFTILFAILLLLLGGFVFRMFHDPSSQGLQAKEEWADLQSIEAELGGKLLKETTIVPLRNSAVLEIPGAQSGGPGIVILLSAKAEPYYKQMPEGTYRLTPADYQKVEASGDASETVLAVLSSHVDPR